MTNPRSKYTYRPTPQLSANQLSDYLTASPPRRKAIIVAAKFPKTSVVAQYEGARVGLVKFLNDGTRSFRHLTDAVDGQARRHSRADATDWVKRDSRSSIEAIEAFQASYNKLGVTKLDCREVTGRQPLLDNWQTKISVHLNLTVHRPTSGETDKVGGVILAFSKGEDKDRKRHDRLKTTANLIFLFCQRFLTHYGEADKKLCFAVDVFARKSVQPSGEYLRGMKQIEESCEEIADRWDAIAPPDDYDGPNWR